MRHQMHIVMWLLLLNHRLPCCRLKNTVDLLPKLAPLYDW